MIDYKKYTNIDLIEFEKEIFGDNLDNGKTFKDYLIEQGAWIINGKYKDGAVRNPTKYIMLNEKWECLQMLRYKREKAKQYEQEDNKAIQDKPISKNEKPYTHDIGCEIQHTGKCSCGYKEDDHLTEDQKETLKTIPF